MSPSNRNARWSVIVDGRAPYPAGLTFDVALAVFDPFATLGHWHTGAVRDGQFCSLCERSLSEKAVRS